MDAVIELTTNETIALAQHAEAIRVLGKRAVKDVLEIGARLTAAKALAGHGGFDPWLDREFAWTDRQARRFMDVYEMAGKSDKLSDLNIPISGLYLLAAPSTPEQVREAIVEKTERGESVSVAEVKRMIGEATKKQKQEEAERLAAQREADQTKAEAKVAKLQQQFEAREKKLREEFDGMVSLDEVEAKIEKHIAPLQKKLEKAQEMVERLKKPPAKNVDKKGLESAGLAYALEHLSEACLKIKPDQVLDHQRFVTEATGQTMKAGLAEKITNAKRVVAWLEKFIAITEGV